MPTKTSLAGKRLGVVRDFMIEATLADRDSIRIANEALEDMKRLGATLVDPVDFTAAIAEIMTAYDPGFFSADVPAGDPCGHQSDRSPVQIAIGSEDVCRAVFAVSIFA